MITDNAEQILKERYYLKDSDGKLIENWSDLCTRVATAVASAEATGNLVEANIDKFYNMMYELDFLPNSPCLMNAGTDTPQTAACFVLSIEDNMEDIFQTLKESALIFKSGGGVGYDFSNLRPRNSLVKSTQGVASGPVSFISIFDKMTDIIKSGGKRRGASMGVLRCDHPDIVDFITCKDDDNAINNFNLSVAITDSFMESIRNNETYSCGIFKLIVEQAWNNGDPGILFIDEANRTNPTPHLGNYATTNPCGETYLLSGEACVLGSINLTNHLNSKNEIDWGHLEKTVQTAVRFLDNCIDVSSFPFQFITDAVKGNRKIGLGVMGFADILITMGVRYGSEDSIILAEQIMESINSIAKRYSIKLAKEKGHYPNHVGTLSSRIRNATRTTIAPTGTISRIANCSSGIEPLFALSYTSKIMDIEQTYFNEALQEAVDKGCQGDPLKIIINIDGTLKVLFRESLHDIIDIPELQAFATSHDIKPEDHIRMQAAFQKYTDNAVSKTINMPNSATKEDVRKAFILAHELGCKGITIYRDGSREQVLNKPEAKSPSKACEPSINRPDILKGTTTRKPTGCGNVYVTINTKDGKPYEVISTMGKSGGCSASYIEALCRIISLGLKNGIPLSGMAGQLRGIRCPIPKLGKETILSCSDAISSVFFEHLGEKVPEVQSAADTGLNPQCPECGNQLVHSGGCVECSNKGCGYSRCA